MLRYMPKLKKDKLKNVRAGRERWRQWRSNELLEDVFA